MGNDGSPFSGLFAKASVMWAWRFRRDAAVSGVGYVWDKAVGHDGKASLRLHKTVQRYSPIAQWHQFVPNPGTTSKLKVSAWVKAERATKGIVDVLFFGQDGKMTHQWIAYIGAKKANQPPVSHDWKQYTGVAEIPPGTTRLGVALQIYGDFVEAVVRDVAGRHSLDERHVFTLSWSSGGPAAYAISLAQKKSITGSYVAMSVFKPEFLPPLKNARGHAYFIDHSPDDRICPFRMAKAAEQSLEKHGASVRFNTYEGGHGWRGDVYGRIRSGIEWLETHTASDR